MPLGAPGGHPSASAERFHVPPNCPRRRPHSDGEGVDQLVALVRSYYTAVVPAKAGTQGAAGPVTPPSPSTGEGWGEGDTPAVGADPRVRPLPGSHTPSPSTGEGWGEGDSSVVPAKAGTHPRDPEPGSQLETKNSKLKTLPARRPRTRRTRTQRRRDGNARAAILGKGSERNKEEKQDKPAAAELTISERRISEKLKQHWHEPDPWAGPIDSTTPGRSPPW